MHVTLAKSAVGASLSVGTFALTVSNLYEPIKFVGVCVAVVGSILTVISLGMDLRKKWRDRNK